MPFINDASLAAAELALEAEKAVLATGNALLPPPPPPPSETLGKAMSKIENKYWKWLSFHGDGGHAGAQLMPLRNDASLAVAELALEVEKAVLATGNASARHPPDMDVLPNPIPNSLKRLCSPPCFRQRPSRKSMSLDVKQVLDAADLSLG